MMCEKMLHIASSTGTFSSHAGRHAGRLQAKTDLFLQGELKFGIGEGDALLCEAVVVGACRLTGEY